MTKILIFLYKYFIQVFQMIYVKFHCDAKISCSVNKQNLFICLFTEQLISALLWINLCRDCTDNIFGALQDPPTASPAFLG